MDIFDDTCNDVPDMPPDVFSHDTPRVMRVVYSLEKVRHTYVYGYNLPDDFIKICVYNDSSRRKLSDLLRRGGFRNTKFRVFDAHIDIYSQFMNDYNLYGFNTATCHPSLHSYDPIYRMHTLHTDVS